MNRAIRATEPLDATAPPLVTGDPGSHVQHARDASFDSVWANIVAGRDTLRAFPGEKIIKLTSGFNGPEQSPLVEDYHRREHRLTLVNVGVCRSDRTTVNLSRSGEPPSGW